MRRIRILLIALLLCAASGCGIRTEGDISNVQIETVKSALYSQEDIDAAIAVILKDFKAQFTDCTLTRIAYASDEITQKAIEWHREGYEESWGDFDELIMLLSDLTANSDTGGFNKGTYTNWNWILVRESGGTWRHVDHGY